MSPDIVFGLIMYGIGVATGVILYHVYLLVKNNSS